MFANKKVLLAGLFGNAIEWYDFILYANFAVIIGHLFFPVSDPFTSLLLTFGVFASGILVRPIGAFLFGYLGDHWGRRTALIISISLMSIPTLLIGFLPTYASIGIAAPLLLLVLRLCQGIAVSGELNSATTFLIEQVIGDRRGLAGSLVMCSAFIGILCGAILSTGITEWLSPAALAAWGWRVLFSLGGLIGILGLVMRLRMPESVHFQQRCQKNTRLSIAHVFTHHLVLQKPTASIY